MLQIFAARYLLPITAPLIEDGALAVEGEKIVAVGSQAELLARYPEAPLTDFGAAVLLPPFANAHTHLELSLYPRWRQHYLGAEAHPTSFVDWILQLIRVKRQLEPELYREAITAGIRLSLAAGTGAVGDILSWWPAQDAHESSPLLGRLFFETLGHDPERCRRQLSQISERLIAGTVGRLSLGISPHAPYTLSRAHLRTTLEHCRQQSHPWSLHLAESLDEVTFLEESRGALAERLYPAVGWQDLLPPPARRRPFPYLWDQNPGEGGLLVHGVQINAAEIAELAARGNTVVLCPRSNATLGVGLPPLAAYLQVGVPLAFGTDSLASNKSLSLWDEIAFVAACYGEAVSPETLLQLATQGGAKALGLGETMGALSTGFGAHFQILKPTLLPEKDRLLSFLCQSGRSAEVTALYLDGVERLQNAQTPSIIPAP
ncbi:MAG: metal-dependent hydrolase [Desulfuromonas sp.]|nr:MAG: metal-dependent hydrolase [Desulfuromonas sp.]